MERKEKLRMKQVKFSARPSENQGNATADQRTSRLRLSSKFPFMKSKDNIMKEELSESSDSDFELADDWVLSYEPVHQVDNLLKNLAFTNSQFRWKFMILVLLLYLVH